MAEASGVLFHEAWLALSMGYYAAQSEQGVEVLAVPGGCTQLQARAKAGPGAPARAEPPQRLRWGLS